MSKKLAVRGHSTRGKEVIKLLEMMGGKNTYNLLGNDEKFIYYVIECNEIKGIPFIYDLEDYPGYIFFTLEEFLEKYPFRIGNEVIDKADGCPGIVDEMKWDESVSDMKYFVAFGNGIDFGWFTNDSIEFCKEDKNLEETQSKRDIDKSEFIIKHMMLPNKVDAKLEYEIIDGYEFDRVDNGKIILKPIKSKYPNDYKTCCDALYANSNHNECYEVGLRGYPIQTFARLIICRDAYWKIAGEKMGLGKSWEHDYLKDANTIRYTIYNTGDEIVKLDGKLYRNYTLCFPTEEMRDVFYDNFKDLIESCKEWL